MPFKRGPVTVLPVIGIMRRRPAGVWPTATGGAMVTARSHTCSSAVGGKVMADLPNKGNAQFKTQRVAGCHVGSDGFFVLPIQAVSDERMASSTDMSSTCTQSRGTNTV